MIQVLSIVEALCVGIAFGLWQHSAAAGDFAFFLMAYWLLEKEKDRR